MGKIGLFLILFIEVNKLSFYNQVGVTLSKGQETHVHRFFASASDEMVEQLSACDFEVFGRVQGVFFRKYTQKQAISLGLTGWCKNTHDDTVKGQMEGTIKQLSEMKHWLQNVGSPSSKIDKAVFSESKELKSRQFNSFQIKH